MSKRTHIDSYAKPVPGRNAAKMRAYMIGSGMAALSAACFLIRDAGMPGNHITILEKEHLPGGALDGYNFEDIGFLMRGEHRFDAHAACLWDLLGSIPGRHGEDSALEELARLSERDPNYAIIRVTTGRGEDAHPGTAGLSDMGCRELMKLFAASDEELAEKRIQEVLSPETLSSDFFFRLRTLFHFTEKHGALELKMTLKRYAASLGDLADMRAFLYTECNSYDSLVIPLVSFLTSHGVTFRYGTKVTDVAFDCALGRRKATRIDYVTEEGSGCIDLTDEDLVFITAGSCTENSTRGSQTESAPYMTEIREGGSFDLWRKISEQDVAFGHPEVFSLVPEITGILTATVTLKDAAILPYIKKICRRDPLSGKVSTGGPVAVKDSPWLLSWSVPRQPVYAGQADGQCIVLLTAEVLDRAGSFADRPARECNGREICEEWLWHIGVPSDEIGELAEKHAATVPVLLPFFTAALMPRVPGDRPDTVPEGAINFAFIGQFAETDQGAALTVDYAVQTAMEAVYALFSIRKPMPEEETPGLRDYIHIAAVLREGRSIRNMDLKRGERAAVRQFLKRLRGTEIEKLMKEERLM